jgi:hypothetical protein
MIEFSLSSWTKTGAALEALGNLMHPDTMLGLMSEKLPLLKSLKEIAEACDNLKLVNSRDETLDLVARLIKYQTPLESTPDKVPWPPQEEIDALLRSWREIRAEALTPENFIWSIQNLKRSIHRELDSRVFVFIDPLLVAQYQNPIPFGEAVAEAFPSSLSDSVEAAKCLAVDRATACVFHLMRVMEVGLKAVAKALGVPYISEWGRCIGEMEKVQPKSAFFTDAVAHLRTVKNAWRNPTMHIERQYSDREAETIFRAVEAFMLHLATKLTE